MQPKRHTFNVTAAGAAAALLTTKQECLPEVANKCEQSVVTAAAAAPLIAMQKFFPASAIW